MKSWWKKKLKQWKTMKLARVRDFIFSTHAYIHTYVYVYMYIHILSMGRTKFKCCEYDFGNKTDKFYNCTIAHYKLTCATVHFHLCDSFKYWHRKVWSFFTVTETPSPIHTYVCMYFQDHCFTWHIIIYTWENPYNTCLQVWMYLILQ